jgi:hypothetical protein
MCGVRTAPQKVHMHQPPLKPTTQAKRQPKKTVPGKALAEATQPNGLSALGTPYPDEYEGTSRFLVTASSAKIGFW